MIGVYHLDFDTQKKISTMTTSYLVTRIQGRCKEHHIYEKFGNAPF